METGDRRPVARAYGGASGDRGGRGGLRAQPHAGTGAPEVRPRRLTPDGVGVSATKPMIRAPRWRALPAQRLALELDAVRIVNQAIEDGVGQRRILDAVMMPPLWIVWCVAREPEAR